MYVPLLYFCETITKLINNMQTQVHLDTLHQRTIIFIQHKTCISKYTTRKLLFQIINYGYLRTITATRTSAVVWQNWTVYFAPRRPWNYWTNLRRLAAPQHSHHGTLIDTRKCREGRFDTLIFFYLIFSSLAQQT